MRRYIRAPGKRKRIGTTNCKRRQYKRLSVTAWILHVDDSARSAATYTRGAGVNQMAQRKSPAATDTAANDAAPIDTAAVAGTASVEIEGKTIETITSAAIEAARASIASIETALALVANVPAASAALSAELETARGVLALAESDAALDAEKAASIEAARSAAAAAKLPDSVLAAMLLAIETQYAPAPPAVETAPAVALPAYGRKQVSARTAERNADALAVMAADSSVGVRVADTYNAFARDWAGDLRGVAAAAGTRYVSIVCFAGAGVANVGDYRRLVPQMRQHLLTLGLAAGGATFASDPWLFGFGPHAAGGPKGDDTLTRKFRSGAGIALHADGRFRLTARGTAGVRFVSSDAAALAAWNGSDATPAAAPAVPATDAPSSAPRTPTPPPVIATPNGGLTATARCQHCTARNLASNTECSACGAADWNVA